MSSRMFIRLMLVLLVFTAGLFAFSLPGRQQAEVKECPAGSSCSNDNMQTAATDGMIWESVSKHLLNVIQ